MMNTPRTSDLPGAASGRSRRRTRGRVVAVLGVLLLAALSLAAIGGTAGATAPPYEPDPNAIGVLTFFDATGHVVTSGNVNDAPIAAYVQASGAGRVGDSKASLYGYSPKNGVATGSWSGELLTASTTYPVATAPSPLNTSPLPLVKGSAADTDLATLIADFPNTATDSYQGLYQLRIKTSGAGQPAGSTYDVADIFVSGSTWTQVYPVPATATTTTLGVSPASPSISGTAVTLTATLSPSNAVGSVQFFDGASPIGSPVAVSAGTAQTTTSSLSVAAHNLTAAFTPTDGAVFTPSTSSIVPYTVNKPPATATSTALLVTPASPVISGASVTLQATLTPSNAVGSVQFFDGVSPIGSPVTVAAGSASTSTSALSVATHSLTAAFTPTDATDFVASTSTATSYTVNAPPPTATSTALAVTPASPVLTGASVTLQATLTPSNAVGSVQFFDGASPIGSPVAVSAGTAQTITSSLAAATHSLTAAFTPTDAGVFVASVSTATSYVVNSPPPTAVATTTGLSVSPASPVAFGTSVTLQATLSPSNAVGSVQFFDGATPIGSPVAVASGTAQTTTSSLAAATHALSVSFTPTDANAFTSSASTATSFTVNPPPAVSTSTALSVSPSSPVTAGTSVTLHATLTPSNAVGSVQFFDGASPIGAPVAVSSGAAQLTTSSLSVATHSLTAGFTPTNAALFTSSASTATSFTVNVAPPTTTSTGLSVTPGGPVTFGTSVTIHASLTPVGAVGSVQFLDGGSPIGGPVAVVSGSAQFVTSSLSVATHSLTAAFTPTNALNFTASTSSATSLVVNVVPPTSTSVALSVTPATPVTAGTEVTLLATLTPGSAAGTVQFFDGATAIGSPVTVSGGTAQTTTSTLSIATHSLTAAFTPASALNFTASTSAASSLEVVAPPDIAVTDSSGNPIDPGAELRPGDTIHVTGSGFTPGETVTITVQSTPVTVGTAVADSDGNISTDVTLPDDLEPGSHTLSLVGSEVTRTFAFVVADPATTTTTADPSTTTSLDSSGDGTGSGSTDTSGTLPTTGFDAFPLVLLGLGLVLAGSAALILGRRRSVLR